MLNPAQVEEASIEQFKDWAGKSVSAAITAQEVPASSFTFDGQLTAIVGVELTSSITIFALPWLIPAGTKLSDMLTTTVHEAGAASP